MNVLIAGGFWAIAKFMVLLCGTVILIIKSIYLHFDYILSAKLCQY